MTSAAILILQLALALITWLKQSQSIEAGRDEEIARSAAAILAQTDSARRILAEVMAMPENKVDDVLRSLEPQ